MISAHPAQNRRDGPTLGCSLNETRNVWDPRGSSINHPPLPSRSLSSPRLASARVAGLDSVEPRGPQHPYRAWPETESVGRGRERRTTKPDSQPPPAPSSRSLRPAGRGSSGEPGPGQAERRADVTAPGGGTALRG